LDLTLNAPQAWCQIRPLPQADNLLRDSFGGESDVQVKEKTESRFTCGIFGRYVRLCCGGRGNSKARSPERETQDFRDAYRKKRGSPPGPEAIPAT
jgi:hypothetical protein